MPQGEHPIFETDGRTSRKTKMVSASCPLVQIPKEDRFESGFSPEEKDRWRFALVGVVKGKEPLGRQSLGLAGRKCDFPRGTGRLTIQNRPYAAQFQNPQSEPHGNRKHPESLRRIPMKPNGWLRARLTVSADLSRLKCLHSFFSQCRHRILNHLVPGWEKAIFYFSRIHYFRYRQSVAFLERFSN